MYSYFMLNKPAGYLTACRDEARPTVMEFFPPELRDRLHPVGRLDFDTHGLLLFTDDGRVDRALLNPQRHVSKKYSFFAIGELTEDKIRRLESGVGIGDSGVISKPARVRKTADAKVRDYKEYFPPYRRSRYMKNPDGPAFAAELEISEGRKHQVKLMLRAVNCRIVYLKRLEIGGIILDPELPEGSFRPLNDNEMKIIHELEEKLAEAEAASEKAGGDMNVSNLILDLVTYGEKNGLCHEDDRTFIINSLCTALHCGDFAPDREAENRPLEEILCDLDDAAGERGLLEDKASVVYRDLFDTSLMGILTPLPHEVNAEFRRLYGEKPEAATDYFYRLCRACDYIRTYRVKKDLKWVSPSKYGDLDITINLSKPEKDPKAIAAARSAPQSGYPKCLLCHENEGYAGSVSKPARQNLRQIPLTLDGKRWFMQYSPYVYYNEHCIVLSGEHTPMKIDASTFRRALDFVEFLPHYFIGSNADLPIVGGSILTHDHMQGGRYCFPMEKAGIEEEISFCGFEQVKAGIVKWPMSVIRLQSADKTELVKLANKILVKWRSYTDKEAFVFAETDGQPHNTITPIARTRDGKFELDLVLRNNITTSEHPMGVYHPHAELHHIKKENIGLIEVMGLAVLPSRLKKELENLRTAILENRDISGDEELSKHAEWLAELREKYVFTAENTEDILKREVGRVFERVLEDAGVYKCTPGGRSAMKRFIAAVNE